MTAIELDEASLETYRPTQHAPADFDDVWARTLKEARDHPIDVRTRRVDTGLTLVDVDDLTFAGFGGERVSAWLVRPANATGPLPVVVEYNGYGGGRGVAHQHLLWAAAGFAHLFMDTRGQGSAWGNGGDTPDPHGSGPALPGFMTRGIESFETYYYRRLITDAVRAVDAVRDLPGIDTDRIVVKGASQGGGLALATAGLVDGLAGALIDVPFLCHIRRGIEVSDTDPYGEIVRYLAVHRGAIEQTLATLDYVDGMHHAARATAPALFSVALRDNVCPPSTVFAAQHAYAGPSEITRYAFNNHEGGQGHQERVQLDWLRARGLTPAEAS